MIYHDVMHPVNIACLLYDVLCVTAQSFSPETLVRKRLRRGRHEAEQRGRKLQRSTNTTLNLSAYTNGELPPPVPQRKSLDDSQRHRTRSRSGGRRERERERERERKKEGQGKSFLSRWLDMDVTKQTILLMHILRASPVSVLHFFCQVKTETDTLPLLRFSDLNDTAQRLLCFGVDGVFASDFIIPFLLTRLVLDIAQQYLMRRIFLETNVVVRNLRSRRAWRNAIGWALSLSSHTLTDPIAFSILTPILLNRVRDFSPVTGPLRYTPSGLFKGITIGFAGVVLEMMITPAASQLCQRAVVRIADGMEYLLFRRYARHTFGGLANDEMKDGIANNMNSEDERGDMASSFAGSVNSSRASIGLAGTKTSERSGRRSHDVSRSHSRDSGKNNNNGDNHSVNAEKKLDRRRAEERRRRREEEEERRKIEADHRTILRAIIYRVISALISQCLVQHPLAVIAHMLYGRAVINATGLLTLYDGAPNVPLTWRACLQFLRDCIRSSGSAEQSSGVPAVELLRSIGRFIGCEVGMVCSSIRYRSTRDVAIRALITRAQQNKSINNSGGNSGNRSKVEASAMDSVQLMLLSIASLSPLCTALPYTAIDNLLGFYMAVWVRLKGD